LKQNELELEYQIKVENIRSDVLNQLRGEREQEMVKKLHSKIEKKLTAELTSKLTREIETRIRSEITPKLKQEATQGNMKAIS